MSVWRRSTASVFTVCVAVVCSVIGGCDQFAAIGLAPLQLDGGRVDVPADRPDASASVMGPVAGDPDAAMAGGGIADAGLSTLEDASSSQCVPPTVTGCNPVTNTGCPDALQMQCAVDLATTLAGYCIFSGPPSPGTFPCLNTLVTESCAPMSACVDGECRKLCFCDSDCEAGQCCNGPIAAHGFSACGDC